MRSAAPLGQISTVDALRLELDRQRQLRFERLKIAKLICHIIGLARRDELRNVERRRLTALDAFELQSSRRPTPAGCARWPAPATTAASSGARRRSVAPRGFGSAVPRRHPAARRSRDRTPAPLPALGSALADRPASIPPASTWRGRCPRPFPRSQAAAAARRWRPAPRQAARQAPARSRRCSSMEYPLW